ncbi:MAG: hypothetical protein ACXABY_19900, partial [Candidatus Thorarchaeota archaeon]|jgi:hypothetical protein
MLGVELESGRELWSGKAQVTAAQLTGEDTATVFMRERHKLDPVTWGKYFSEDIKFMGRGRTPEDMSAMLRLAGGADVIAGQQIEAIASGKLVGKRRMALMTQQIEAMSAFLGEKLGTPGALTGARGRAAEEFLMNPSQVLKLETLMGEGIADAEYQIQKNMVLMSKKFGFSQKEIGLTFGLMKPELAGKIGAELGMPRFAPELAAAIEKSPLVLGLSKMKLGQMAAEGVGGMAKLEHTGFRMIAMKEEGARLVAEFATRIQGKGGAVAADLMEQSMLGERGLVGKAKDILGKTKVDPRTLGQFGSLEELIKDTGRYVDVGRKVEAFGGASRIYIPGAIEAESFMLSSMSQKGAVMPSQVGRGLEEFRGLLAKKASDEEIEASAVALRSLVAQEAEKQVTPKGGAIFGSRSFTNIRQTADVADDTFRISRRQGEGMWNDLIDRARSSKHREYLKEQKRLLLEEGETLIGGIWRHPTTGPESFQAVRYKVDAALADEIVSVPYRRGTIDFGRGPKTLNFSQMVGMKADFDKDTLNLAAIADRDTAKRLAGKMDKEIQSGYTKYLFNHYAMKELMGTGEKALDLSRQEALQLGARNLVTAKVATPEVNLAMQKLKIAMQHAAPSEYRPMAEMLFHMEESAISGKLGSFETEMYEQIGRAVNQRDATSMESVVKMIMGEKDRRISGTMLSETGQALGQHTYDYRSGKITQDMMRALAATGEDADWAIKAAQSAKSLKRTPQDINELIAMYYKRRTGSLDVPQAVMRAKDYGMEGFTQKATRAMRKASTKASLVGQAMSKAKAPLMIGAAVAAGVMLAAPAMSGHMPQKEGPAGGRNLGFSDLGPPTGMGMSPPAARIMSSPKAYDMSGIKMSSRANIRMSMPDADRAGADFMRQARTLASNSNVRIRTVDDRHALNPHRLASKIHERL